jgi:uncharacterized alpha-E superfamily protein
LMTYRSRYLLQLQSTAVIDLLINDDTNPRSIAYQLKAIERFLGELPTDGQKSELGPDQKLASELATAVFSSKPTELSIVNAKAIRPKLSELLEQLLDGLPKLSDAISARYLIHTATQRLTGRPGATK